MPTVTGAANAAPEAGTTIATLGGTGTGGGGDVAVTLRTLEPLTKSPIIWASIATGKVPKKHGVLDFFVKQGQKEREAARAKGVQTSLNK